jgi:deoxyribonuclease-4
MRIGAHVSPADPLDEAAVRDADIVQFFLSNPQSWAKPTPRPDTASLLASDLAIVIHAPYLINVATTNNRVRVPSRGLLSAYAAAAHDIGALGVVVHGGHLPIEDDPAVGVENWRKTFEYAEREGGFATRLFIENTAGGKNAMTRNFDRFAQLWDAIGGFGPGVCIDTCHAHAAGEELGTVVDRITAITGRIDLIHANDSKDEFGSGRDRHDNLGNGRIAIQELCDVVAAADAPAIVETPGGPENQAADIALLRAFLASRSNMQGSNP